LITISRTGTPACLKSKNRIPCSSLLAKGKDRNLVREIQEKSRTGTLPV